MLLFFFQNKTDDYLYLYIRNLENLHLKPFFLVHNIHLHLCWQVEDIKWILCCQKIGVKCAYLRFLIYKKYVCIICALCIYKNSTLYSSFHFLTGEVIRGLYFKLDCFFLMQMIYSSTNMDKSGMNTCAPAGLILIQPDPHFVKPILTVGVVPFYLNIIFIYLNFFTFLSEYFTYLYFIIIKIILFLQLKLPKTVFFKLW